MLFVPIKFIQIRQFAVDRPPLLIRQLSIRVNSLSAVLVFVIQPAVSPMEPIAERITVEEPWNDLWIIWKLFPYLSLQEIKYVGLSQNKN